MIPRLAYFDDPLPFALAIGGETPWSESAGHRVRGKARGIGTASDTGRVPAS